MATKLNGLVGRKGLPPTNSIKCLSIMTSEITPYSSEKDRIIIAEWRKKDTSNRPTV